ncbi:MAG: hypothetical protein HC901_03885, partial [Bdellovibrionaceae bacterium]|nr:hypothetical protein [Pseudobdellovibrionaceae bacterium]
PRGPAVEDGVRRAKRDIVNFWNEALNNAVRHAKASEIKVEIEWLNKSLRLLVEDNGVGFEDTADGREGSENGGEHYGLASMRQRAQDLGGRLTIDSRPRTRDPRRTIDSHLNQAGPASP